MSHPVRPGDVLPIPCRGCRSGMIPLTVDWGLQLLTCRICHQVTQVDVREELGVVRIRTRLYGT